MMVIPSVSVILSTKNALPHLRDAIAGLERQTHRNFRLIVQDGGSTDGTLEYLRSLKLGFEIDIDSRPDSGLAQAYARGLARTRDPYCVLASADEILSADALSYLLARHEGNSEFVVVYSSIEIVDPEGKVLQTFRPRPFDFYEAVACVTAVPIATCMFNRLAIGEEFYYDETLRSCPDYEFWLRVGSRFEASRFLCCDRVLAKARGDRTSMSYRSEAHVQMAEDKISSLRRFLFTNVGNDLLRDMLERQFGRQIYCWAAEMMRSIDGDTPLFFEIMRRAIALGPPDERLGRLIESSPPLRAWAKDPSRPLPTTASIPSGKNVTVLRDLDVRLFPPYQAWGSEMHVGDAVEVRGGPSEWGYSWQLPLDLSEHDGAADQLWLRVQFRVLKGRIGWSLLEGEQIVGEGCYSPSEGSSFWSMQLGAIPLNCNLLLRNAGQAYSAVEINRVAIVAVS